MASSWRSRLAVGAVGHHRLVRVADGDHAGAERDLLAGQAVGVALRRPSARGWSAPARATGRRAGAAIRIRSPIRVWRRMNCHSSSFSGPGLFRIASGMATLPMSCSSAARATSSRSSAGMPSSAATGAASAATSVDVVVQVGLALAHGRDQHVAGLVGGGGRGYGPCRRTCAGRPGAGPRRGSRLAGQADGAQRGRDREAVAVLGQRLGARRPPGRRTWRASHVDQDAELVAAQAEGRAVGLRPPAPGGRPGGPAGSRRRGGRTSRCRP